ncbi:MAG TPA: glycosyltransferase [Pseudonocardiaceae bacterium]|nr:glycosyltransferase [Pseudonocardiaceae bacterium]
MASKNVATIEAAPAATEKPRESTGELLQRVIVPRAGDPHDVRALYLDEGRSNQRRTRGHGRTEMDIPADAEISFATYFNAFPASYWRRWTALSMVELRLSVSDSCRVDIYRSKGDGTQIHVQGRLIDRAGDVTFTLDLRPFEDGGWYWFDVTTDERPVTLRDCGWYAPMAAPGRSSVAIAITTFNRQADCVGALGAIGEDPLVLDAVAAVFVADQGTNKVRDADGFDVAAAALGDRLRIIDQANMGGSGGYARGMYETLTTTECDHVLLMDDDVVVEPDAILRSLAFSRFAKNPMIVGGQMLDLQDRSVLHSMGEVIDRSNFMWRAAPNVTYRHDFAEYPLRDEESEDLHRRIDVEYNGWWCCLIPRTIVERIGLPLPLFIKWDDAEYSLRAAQIGCPTASLPGVAIWHMAWSNKDDAVDWQAYFHLRNRLVVAAMYTPHRRGGRLLLDNLKFSLRLLLSLQYSTIALHDMAIRDFLAGPDHLFDLLPAVLPDVRKRRGEFDDGRVLPSASDFPLPSMDVVRAEMFLRPPTNVVAKVKTLATGLVHNLLPAKPEHYERPQLNVAAQDARWFLLSRIDGATVATADGSGVAYRKRNPKTFWTLLRVALANHVQLAREFPRLRKVYQKARPDLTSLESWRKVFQS